MHVGVWACEGVLSTAVSPWALLRIGPANTVRDSPMVGSISRLEPLAIGCLRCISPQGALLAA